MFWLLICLFRPYLYVSAELVDTHLANTLSTLITLDIDSFLFLFYDHRNILPERAFPERKIVHSLAPVLADLNTEICRTRLDNLDSHIFTPPARVCAFYTFPSNPNHIIFIFHNMIKQVFRKQSTRCCMLQPFLERQQWSMV